MIPLRKLNSVYRPQIPFALNLSSQSPGRSKTPSKSPKSASSPKSPSPSYLKVGSAFGYIVSLLISIAFVYSYAAFKPVLREQFGWNELQGAYIFTFANFGLNFVVHMGMLYDWGGAGITSLVAGTFKV